MLVTRDDNTLETNSTYLATCGLKLRPINNRGKSVLYGRIKAYNETNANLVSYINDDDYSMLTKDSIEFIRVLNKDALFTNSLFKTYKAWIPLCSTNILEYKKEYEDRSLLCPHQTIVLRRTLAIDLLKETQELIKSKDWDENSCDFVLRNIVTNKNLWYYYPEITYKWVNQNNGLHTTQVSLNQEIRKYFKQLKTS